MTDWISESLAEHHSLSRFDCGVPELNDWLTGQALRATGSGTARTYVWVPSGSDRVVAYYAITPHQVSRDEVSRGMSGGVGVIPAYLLAKLALDQELHGQGLGGELLHDALDRILAAADLASGRLVVVDAIDDQAAKFYRKYDFQPVRDNPRRLVVKISTLRQAFGR
ncbi:GNAT family N-acetyltransferase [Crossiella sp. CA198]|uniref:GNAT family N-acetyltransferase n=1 Tax=Crossiella sp. CA198 TaxID=3455607 RepID=UPI003F8D8CD8